MALAVLNRFLNWMIIGIISPILVLAIISKGIALESVGFVMALTSTFVVVCEVPSGVLSDRVGRKAIYLASLAGFFLAFLVILLGRGFLAMALGFSLFGIARAFSSGSIESDFIDAYISKKGKDDLHRLMTGMNIGEATGLAVGALLGGFLPGVWKALSPGTNIYDGNLICMLALVATLFIITVLTHKAAMTSTHASLTDFIREAGQVLGKSAVLRYVLAGTALWGFAFNAIELYWQPRLQTILATDEDLYVFGILNSAYFVAAVLGSMLIGALMRKIRMSKQLIIGIMRMALGAALVLLSFQDGLLGFSFFFLVIMGFNGMAGVPESTLFNEKIPADKRSSLLSLSSLVMQCGGIAASIVFSLLKAHTSIEVIWLVAGMVFAGSSVLYFRLNQRERLPETASLAKAASDPR